jgi:hypothetical protein
MDKPGDSRSSGHTSKPPGGEYYRRAATRCCKIVTVITIRKWWSKLAANMSNIIPFFASATTARFHTRAARFKVRKSQ